MLLLCTLGVSPQAFYNETAKDLARFLKHICAPTDVTFRVRVTRKREGECLFMSQIQAVVLKMKACFTIVVGEGKSVDTWSAVRASNPFYPDFNNDLVAFLEEVAGLTVTDEGLKEAKRRNEGGRGIRCSWLTRKMLTRHTEETRAAAAGKSTEEQAGGKETDGNRDASPGPKKKRPSVQLSGDKLNAASTKPRNESGTAGLRNHSNDDRPVYRPSILSDQAKGTMVGGTGKRQYGKGERKWEWECGKRNLGPGKGQIGAAG